MEMPLAVCDQDQEAPGGGSICKEKFSRTTKSVGVQARYRLIPQLSAALSESCGLYSRMLILLG